MVNLLVGNSNINEIILLCQELANEKNIKIQKTLTGIDTLSMYWKLNPDILVLDSNLKDISMENMLNRLCDNPVEEKKCNTILTVPQDSQLIIHNVTKVKQIISKPIKNHELTNTIKEMAINFNTPDLGFGEIDYLLQELNFNCLSPGYKYMKSALEYCYYNPYDLEILNNVLNHIGKEHNIPMTRVRDALNSSLRHFGTTNITSKEIDINHIFGNSLNCLTLKDFLTRLTLYIIREKKKGRIF